MKEQSPDSFGLIYFTVQGMATLIAWSAILTSIDYFDDKFPEFSVNFIFPIAIFVANIFISINMVKIQEMLSLNIRVALCLGLMGLTLFIVPIEADLLSNTTVGFVCILGILFILGSFNTIKQASIAGLAGIFPFAYMARFVLGTGLAGLMINFLRIIILLVLGSEANTNKGQIIEILVYFGCSGLFLALCIYLHYKFIKTELYLSYLKVEQKEVNDSIILVEDNENINVNVNINQKESSISINKEALVKKDFIEINSFKRLYQVFVDIIYYALFMILIYIQTFMMFPGVMLLKTMTILDPTWKTVLLVTTFNSFDCLGKILANYRNLYNKYSIGILAVGRLAFFLPYILMAMNGNNPIINDDWFAFVNSALFAVTNGFCTASLFILGPASVPDHKKEIAGFVMAFSLQIGVVIGSFSALSLQQL